MLGTCSMSKMWLIFSWSPNNNHRKDSPFLGVSLVLGVPCEAGCPHQHLYSCICISRVARCRHCSDIYLTCTHRVYMDQKATTEPQHLPQINITHLIHLSPPWVPPAVSEPHCMETREYCRARAPVAGRVQLQQIYKVPPVWHVALGMELSSHGRIALQHLSLGFQRDMSSPSNCKQTFTNTWEGGMQKAGNGIYQSCKRAQTRLWGICKAMVVLSVMLPAWQLICHLFYPSPNISAFVPQPPSPAIS